MASLGLRPIHLQPLPYGFQESLPELGRGAPWGSRQDLHQQPPAQPSQAQNRNRISFNLGNSIRPGPSGPAGIETNHSDFARRKCCKIQQVRVPCNGGPGVRRIWTQSVHPEPSPGDPQGELPRRGKRGWPGPLGTFPSLGKYLAPQGETLLQQTKGLYHCPLIRPLWGHLPPRGKA